MPLIITLAEIAIEELGVKTSRTVYHEHRYELSGFESLLPPGFVEQLKAGATPQQDYVELPSHFSIRMWSKRTYQPLENMIAEAGQVSDGVLSIRCRSQTKRYLANLLLDFPNYRLKVEVGADDLKDDGSANSIEETIEIERFFWDWNGNGCLEVWSDEGVCLGRCDAFIPVNVIMDSANYKRRMDELSAEAARRRGAG